ncbi:hypothetical protein BP5796_08560 [Coleophoma crateriformis]|uniref:Uncharacterized protein n=1 Tax=Coleophoma crateriformis TaxID=565419 RepID=A0A3D8R7Y2_9HELO|nr:hypothetical protein BP5796_08560 [Coleophoma crateriformis]
MVINPTYLAQRTRQSVNWADAHRRVLKSYREWLRSVRFPPSSVHEYRRDFSSLRLRR